MLRKYCTDTARNFDVGVPLVLFAVRETVQESLGFSLAKLVFGYHVIGLLKVLKEEILMPRVLVLMYWIMSVPSPSKDFK